MFLIDNYEQYSYTKIIVPIELLKSPSDYNDIEYYLDVNVDNFYEESCFIGTKEIEEMKLTRMKVVDCEHNCKAEWKLEMIVNGGKGEDEIIAILDDLCISFSLKFIRYYKHFQHCGFEGFSYERLHLEVKYAYEDKVFKDNACNMYCGSFEMKTISSIDNIVFKLPKQSKRCNVYKNQLIDALLEALRCKDKVSRYILLYYLFEIMYGTAEYQALKERYESIYGKHRCKKDRNVILFQYLQQEFNLKEYSSLGKKVKLDKIILKKIIETRNDLTHRGDFSKVSILMYNHLLPILREVIIKM